MVLLKVFQSKILERGPKITNQKCPRLSINALSIDHGPHCRPVEIYLGMQSKSCIIALVSFGVFGSSSALQGKSTTKQKLQRRKIAFTHRNCQQPRLLSSSKILPSKKGHGQHFSVPHFCFTTFVFNNFWAGMESKKDYCGFVCTVSSLKK